jgi:hypothetical protein
MLAAAIVISQTRKTRRSNSWNVQGRGRIEGIVRIVLFRLAEIGFEPEPLAAAPDKANADYANHHFHCTNVVGGIQVFAPRAASYCPDHHCGAAANFDAFSPSVG